jgi:hypothetical protein
MEHFNQPHMPENSLHPSSPHPLLRQDSRHDSSVSRKDHDDKPAKTVEAGKSDGTQKTGFAKFFSGISWVQILSGGLAAVTVFLLSARLGFAGTIVGAALASMISTFSSQFFQNILNESEKKIKKVAKSIPASSSSSEPEDVSHTPRVASNIAVVRAQEEQITQMEPPFPSVAEANASLRSGNGSTGRSEDTSTISSTSLMPPLPSSPSSPSNQSQQPDANSPMPQGASDDSAEEAGGESQLASSQHLTKKGTASTQHRKTVILSLVATLVSVLLVAGGILLMTHGQGTGPVVPSTRIEKSDESKRTPQKQSTTPSQNSGSTGSQDSNQGADKNSDSQSSQSQTQTPSQSQSDQNSNSGSSSSDSNNSNSSGSDSSSTNSGQSNSGSGSSGSDSTDNSGSSNSSDKSKGDSDSTQDTDGKKSSQSSTDDSSQKDKSSNSSADQSSANNSTSK